MKTIMLCLNQLGIGGVETAVFNQTIQLIKKNYRVVILARDGIYREQFEKEGTIFIEFEFVVQNKYDTDKISKLIKIMDEYEIEQIHIHQFDCINTVFPACILKNVPYVAYVHTGITGVYDWFEKCYPCYKTMFKLYFKSAQKIIAITEQAKQENSIKYGISPNKYMVIKNSIDFERFKIENNKAPNNIEKFLIISRLSREKLQSLKNSIILFKEYYKGNDKSSLTIVGDGECRADIENEIKDIKQIAKMVGEKNNIAEIMSQHDVVIALDRCILEAIAMKKIAVISGYDGIKGIVRPNIIEAASNSNFSGKDFENKEVVEVIEELKKLDEQNIIDIVEKNYQYAYENLNSSKNIYLLENANQKNADIKSIDAINTIIELQNLYVNNVEYTDNVYKECKETQSWLEGKIKLKDEEISDKQKQIDELRCELEKICKSKRWKIANGIGNLFRKI